MKRLVRISLLVLAVLYSPAVVHAVESIDANASEQIEIARGNTSRDELLLFYDEKDLVAATRRKTPLKKAPATATVVTADEIRNMGARNLSDVLKMVPGFGLAIDEIGRQTVEVRGIRTALSEKILVMMDGHRLNESYTGSAFSNLYRDLSVENIKQLEIIRGPGSALYGANAFVAVINVVTKDAEDVKGAALNAGGGSFNTRTASILAGKANNGLQIMGSVNYLDTDGARLKIEQDRLGASGNTDLSLTKTDVFVKALYGDFSFRGQFLDKKRGAYIGYASALTDENVLQYDNFWSDLGYSKKLNDKLFLKLRVYADQFDLSSRFEFFPEGSFGSPDGVLAKTHLIDRTIGTELQLEHKLSEHNRLVYGVQYEKIRQFDVKMFSNFDLSVLPPVFLGSYQDVSSTKNFNKPADRIISALFVQDEWELINSLNLTAGVRYDHYSDFGSTTNPRLGMVWTFSEKGEVKLLYGQAFRAPNFKELYDQNNTFAIGNPNLKPEKIETYEAGVGYRVFQRGKASVNYFYSRIDDSIDRDSTPPKWVNKGEVKVHGVELELAGQYNAADYWRMSYMYQHAENADTGEKLPSVPMHRATAGVNYAVSRYVSAHTDVFWTCDRLRPTGDPRPKAAAYTTVDLALIAGNFAKNFEVRGTVHNLLNRQYKDPDTSGPLQYVPNDFPREGITAMLDVTYAF